MILDFLYSLLGSALKLVHELGLVIFFEMTEEDFCASGLLSKYNGLFSVRENDYFYEIDIFYHFIESFEELIFVRTNNFIAVVDD